ncbi:MAG TPA: hypothetical protein VMK16_00845 [Acidimicrobiales bacterium]|nr:hypothetical protein [Acidimicrobiales bacterium]
MATSGRPYWLHQVAEYIVGLVLLLSIARAHGDAAPLLGAGAALVLINVAISGPPAGCVRMVSRPVHKWTDVAVVAALVAMPIVFHDRASSTVWLVMIFSALVLLVVRLTTNYSVKPPREPMPPISDIAKASPRALGRALGKAQRRPQVP